MSLRRNCPTCRCTCGYCSNIPTSDSNKRCAPQKSGGQKTIYLRLVADCGESSNSTNSCECGESSTKCMTCQSSGESFEDCECDESGESEESSVTSGCGRPDCLCQMFKDNNKGKGSGNQCVVSGQPICCHYCFGDEMENCQQNTKRTCPEKKPWVPVGRSQCGRGSCNSPRSSPCQNQRQQQPQPITIRVCPINIQQQQCRR